MAFFFPFSPGSRKERKEAKARQRSPNQPRRDGWRGEGPERERSLLVGCGSLPGWIDLARVELHHLPCISLFFSQPGEVDSLGRAQYFFFLFFAGGLQQRVKDNKITNTDEVSWFAAIRGYRLCGGALRRESQKGLEKTREEKSLLGYTILPLAMSLCCSAKLMVARQK